VKPSAVSGVEVMKGMVAYDSVHGNTKQVAEAIAKQIRSDGHQVDLISVKEKKGGEAVGEFMFIGSPTRGGRMTKEAKEFIEGLDPERWKGRPIVAFDTVGPLSKDEEKRKNTLKTIEDSSKTAAAKMQECLRERGLSVHPKALHVAVTGMWGPLASDALAMARAFAHQFMAAPK